MRKCLFFLRERPSGKRCDAWACCAVCHPAAWPSGFSGRRSWQRDVTVRMALQLKNGTATYYQSAEFCRNYTSPPVSYGESGHYLARFPGKEPHRITPLECQQSLCAKIGGVGGLFYPGTFADRKYQGNVAVGLVSSSSSPSFSSSAHLGVCNVHHSDHFADAALKNLKLWKTLS